MSTLQISRFLYPQNFTINDQLTFPVDEAVCGVCVFEDLLVDDIETLAASRGHDYFHFLLHLRKDVWAGVRHLGISYDDIWVHLGTTDDLRLSEGGGQFFQGLQHSRVGLVVVIQSTKRAERSTLMVALEPVLNVSRTFSSACEQLKLQLPRYGTKDLRTGHTNSALGSSLDVNSKNTLQRLAYLGSSNTFSEAFNTGREANHHANSRAEAGLLTDEEATAVHVNQEDIEMFVLNRRQLALEEQHASLERRRERAQNAVMQAQNMNGTGVDQSRSSHQAGGGGRPRSRSGRSVRLDPKVQETLDETNTQLSESQTSYTYPRKSNLRSSSGSGRAGGGGGGATSLFSDNGSLTAPPSSLGGGGREGSRDSHVSMEVTKRAPAGNSEVQYEISEVPALTSKSTSPANSESAYPLQRDSTVTPSSLRKTSSFSRSGGGNESRMLSSSHRSMDLTSAGSGRSGTVATTAKSRFRNTQMVERTGMMNVSITTQQTPQRDPYRPTHHKKVNQNANIRDEYGLSDDVQGAINHDGSLSAAAARNNATTNSGSANRTWTGSLNGKKVQVMHPDDDYYQTADEGIGNASSSQYQDGPSMLRDRSSRSVMRGGGGGSDPDQYQEVDSDLEYVTVSRGGGISQNSARGRNRDIPASHQAGGGSGGSSYYTYDRSNRTGSSTRGRTSSGGGGRPSGRPPGGNSPARMKGSDSIKTNAYTYVDTTAPVSNADRSTEEYWDPQSNFYNYQRKGTNPQQGKSRKPREPLRQNGDASRLRYFNPDAGEYFELAQ